MSTQNTAATVVGTVADEDIILVDVGEMWLAHVARTDWDFATGVTPADTVRSLVDRHIPHGYDADVDWALVDRITR